MPPPDAPHIPRPQLPPRPHAHIGAVISSGVPVMVASVRTVPPSLSTDWLTRPLLVTAAKDLYEAARAELPTFQEKASSPSALN